MFQESTTSTRDSTCLKLAVAGFTAGGTPSEECGPTSTTTPTNTSSVAMIIYLPGKTETTAKMMIKHSGLGCLKHQPFR